MATGAETSVTSSRPSRITIQRGKTFAIETPVANKQVRVQICAINDLPYVGITKFWHSDAEDKWLPTKSNVFLPSSTWKGLLLRTHAISQALAQFEKDLKETKDISYGKQLITIVIQILTNELYLNCIAIDPSELDDDISLENAAVPRGFGAGHAGSLLAGANASTIDCANGDCIAPATIVIAAGDKKPTKRSLQAAIVTADGGKKTLKCDQQDKKSTSKKAKAGHSGDSCEAHTGNRSATARGSSDSIIDFTLDGDAQSGY